MWKRLLVPFLLLWPNGEPASPAPAPRRADGVPEPQREAAARAHGRDEVRGEVIGQEYIALLARTVAWFSFKYFPRGLSCGKGLVPKLVDPL